MSGGPMQRVAIARALVNDPDILLADEPTGALDSETSLQVMEILKEISREKLVIMVTHNPDLANQFATRVIRLLDGKVISDSLPYEEAGEAGEKPRQQAKKPSMRFLTALSLSLQNLLTKKGRTLLTAFAGSIGIIGIALILSLSSGVDLYIQRVQRDTLSSYPLEIDQRTIDMTGSLSGLMDLDMEGVEHPEGKIYSGGRMTQFMSTWMSGITENNLVPFKQFLDSETSDIQPLVSAIQYEYDTPLTLFRIGEDGRPIQVNPATTLEATGMMSLLQSASSMGGIQETMMNMSMRRMNIFNVLMDNPQLLASQYDVLAGRMPESIEETVLIVNSRNELTDYTLYTLGIKDQSELKDQFDQLMLGREIQSEEMEFTYEELLNLRFYLMLNTDYFEKQEIGWTDHRGDEAYLAEKLKSAMEIRVVGILRPTEGAVTTSMTTGVGYHPDLMRYLIEKINSTQIVQDQLAHPEINVFTGQPFDTDTVDLISLLDTMSISEFFNQYSSALRLAPEVQERLNQIPAFALNLIRKEDLKQVLRTVLPADSGDTLKKNLTALGVSDPDNPSSILIYPKSFEAKEKIVKLIDAYNAAAGEKNAIQYTDYVGLLMSSVTTIVNAISYVLIAFVAISLVVSSIMIGIITYISVLERTKEIGILRAIGASKRDISRVFNAETLIVGFAAGVLGILVTLLLVLCVNVILHHVAGIANLAVLPGFAALVLVGISMLLTLIAGLIPSRIAARKDPVVALRTE